jgi:predicted nucleic acid-binding protein
MPGKIFLDSNLLAYAQDKGAPKKRERSREIIAKLGGSGEGVISTQVMQEFYVAATRKLGIEPLAAKNVIKTFSVFEVVHITPELIHDAIDCSILNVLSFWDALILSAAAAAQCTTVYSEDLNSGQTILGIQVQNPFVGPPIGQTRR